MATKTFSKPVNRTMEFAIVDIDETFCILYARMEGEKEFTWGFFTHKAAGNKARTMQHPSNMTRMWQPMPHAKARGKKGSYSKESSFRGYLSAMPADLLEDWRTRGVSFNHSQSYDFNPKWGDSLPEGWEMCWWCGYDHTMLRADGSLMNLPIVELACSSSYNMNRLDELVQSDDRFSWTDDGHHYVPGNGESNNLVTKLSDEDYERYLKSGHMSGLYMLFPFLGIDYESYKSEPMDDDDDRW